ncbi:MAG: hypothetical protein NT015_05245 [Alphaproteobacteria bacterium]|nr:hypothetical protein [Alphaproteobacteria bacterium]
MGDVQLDPGAVIGIFGLAAVLVQLYLGRRRERFENTLRIVERLEHPSIIEHRHLVKSLAEKCEGGKISAANLAPNEQVACTEISKLLGLVGYMARRRQIDRDIIIAAWARHILQNYLRLELYLHQRDRLIGGMGFLEDFHWLADRAARYAERHARRHKHTEAEFALEDLQVSRRLRRAEVSMGKSS